MVVPILFRHGTRPGWLREIPARFCQAHLADRFAEGGIIEVPLRRSDLPNEPGKIVPVFLVASPAAFRGEIILVPPLELSFSRQWHLVGFKAADQITAHGDHGLATLWPERCHDVGRPRSPIITGDGR